MRIGVERPGSKGNVRSDDGEVTRLDHELRAIVAAAKAHLAFRYFQSRVMGAHNELERSAYDDYLSLRRHEYKGALRWLLLQCRLHRPVLQLHSFPLFG